MKNAYPVIITKEEDCFLVYVPDFDINTFGTSLSNAIEMGRDAIGGVGLTYEDEKRDIPLPSSPGSVTCPDGAFVTYIDVDFAEERRKEDMRTVKKNCTLPSWLCYKAEQAGINFSQVLQEGLKAQLGLS